MTPENDTLIRLLSYVDELHAPIRLWQTNQPQNLFQRRLLYAREGVPWASEGGTESARKESQRALELLVEAGAVRAIKRGGRTIGVKLGDEAEHYARALCGIEGVAESLEVLGLACRDLEAGFGMKEAFGYTPGGTLLLPETNLTAAEDGSGKCFKYNGESILPLLQTQFKLKHAFVHNWVCSVSDSHGRVYFSVTDLGREINNKPPQLPDDLPDPTDEAASMYTEETSRWYHHFQHAEPPTPHDLAVPLPEGWWPIQHKKKKRLSDS